MRLSKLETWCKEGSLDPSDDDNLITATDALKIKAWSCGSYNASHSTKLALNIRPPSFRCPSCLCAHSLGLPQKHIVDCHSKKTFSCTEDGCKAEFARESKLNVGSPSLFSSSCLHADLLDLLQTHIVNGCSEKTFVCTDDGCKAKSARKTMLNVGPLSLFLHSLDPTRTLSHVLTPTSPCLSSSPLVSPCALT